MCIIKNTNDLCWDVYEICELMLYRWLNPNFHTTESICRWICLPVCQTLWILSVCLYVHLQFLSVCVYIFIYLQFLNIYYLSVGIFYTNGWLEHHIYIAAVCLCLGCLIMTECMNTVLLSQWSVWGCVVCTCVSLGYVQLSCPCSLWATAEQQSLIQSHDLWPTSHIVHISRHWASHRRNSTEQLESYKTWWVSLESLIISHTNIKFDCQIDIKLGAVSVYTFSIIRMMVS